MKSLPLRFAALGDSTSVGVGCEHGGGFPKRLVRRLEARGIEVTFDNLAISGATSRDVVDQARRAAHLGPTLVTLGVGTNDGWRMVEPHIFGENLAAIADALQPIGAQVVVSNLTDLALAPAAAAAVSWLRIPGSTITARIRELNDQIAALARRPGFTVVDLFAFSQRELPHHPEYFCADGFHPSSLGYDRWGELMWPAVAHAVETWDTFVRR